MLDEVEIIPVLHKVTGAGHGCKGGGGGNLGVWTLEGGGGLIPDKIPDKIPEVVKTKVSKPKRYSL